MNDEIITKIMEITNTEALYELIMVNEDNIETSEMSEINNGINMPMNIHYFIKKGLQRDFRTKGKDLWLHGEKIGTMQEYYEEETRRKAMMKKLLLEIYSEDHDNLIGRGGEEQYV